MKPGTSVVIQGPARYLFDAEMRLHLNHGLVSVTCPNEQSVGTSIFAPRLRIVDRGTRFNVVVDGQQVEIDVIDGRVTVFPDAGLQLSPMDVTEGKTLEVDNDGDVNINRSNRFPSFTAESYELDRMKSRGSVPHELFDCYDTLLSDKSLIVWFDWEAVDASGDPVNLAKPWVLHRSSIEPQDFHWVRGRFPTNRAVAFRRSGSSIPFVLTESLKEATFGAWIRLDPMSEDQEENAGFCSLKNGKIGNICIGKLKGMLCEARLLVPVVRSIRPLASLIRRLLMVNGIL